MASQSEKEKLHKELGSFGKLREDEGQYDMPPKKKSFADKAEDAMDKELEKAKQPKKKSAGPMMLKKGGKVRGDGIAKRGKTRGRII